MINKREIIQKIGSFFEEIKDVNSMVLIGSFGRNNPQPDSDIDIQLLIND